MKVFSLSIHVEAIEHLTKVFWIIFYVFGIKDFTKLTYSSITRRLENIQKILASDQGSKLIINLQNWPSIRFTI